MAHTRKLGHIEQQLGDLQEVIPKLLEKHRGSQKEVAHELGVSPFTISTWLKKNNYTPVIIYIKQEPECSN